MAMTTKELCDAMDLDAARSAHASIGAQIESIAFSAPELIGDRLAGVADSMNQLAVALCLTGQAPDKDKAG